MGTKGNLWLKGGGEAVSENGDIQRVRVKKGGEGGDGVGGCGLCGGGWVLGGGCCLKEEGNSSATPVVCVCECMVSLKPSPTTLAHQ